MNKKEFREFKKDILSILKNDLDNISRTVKGLLMSMQKDIVPAAPLVTKSVVKKKKIQKKGKSKKS